jgi:glyoxylase-like metal-dependent hydrolase (beta-lactamase superfamily II)
MDADQALHAQLGERGVDPDDIRLVVMTHLHIDHASGVSEFPGATFVVDQREWDAASRSGGLLRGYHRPQFDHPFDWRTVSYEAKAVDSHATFGQSLDLFGDGSVRLLSTPGHTAGHQSVLLRLAGREALLTIDAAYSRRTVEEDLRPLFVDDEHRFKRSLGEIRHYVEQTPGALVIYGHDPETWPQVEPLYT